MLSTIDSLIKMIDELRTSSQQEKAMGLALQVKDYLTSLERVVQQLKDNEALQSKPRA